MSHHPGWVMVSFLTELISTYGGLGKHSNVGPPPSGGCANDTYIINNLLRDSYNKHYIPQHPTHVKVDMWVQEVTSVSELTQDFEIDLYINEFWTDPALRYDHMSPCKHNISFDDKVLQRLWAPNTCFINSKQSVVHESPFRNVFLMIFSNGSIWSNYRMKVTGPCDMNLKRFPFDQQKCFLTFESFNYNTGEVRMQWNEPFPVMLLKPIQLPDFEMVNFSVIAVEQMYPAGWWDELTVAFVFKRRYGWYILQGYIPTIVTIVISWISFYLGPKAIPARTMLGVNSLLAMTFQFGNIIRNLPRVSYVKAIDVWMLSGMLFIFLSLLELAVVGFMSRNDGMPTRSKKKKTKRRSGTCSGTSGQASETSDNEHDEMTTAAGTATTAGGAEEDEWKSAGALASPRIQLRHFWYEKRQSSTDPGATAATTTVSPLSPVALMMPGLVPHETPNGAHHKGHSESYTTSTYAATHEFDIATVTSGEATMRKSEAAAELTKARVHRPGWKWRKVRRFFTRIVARLSKIRPETVDFYSAIMFPVGAALFNLSYWGYYLSHLSQIDEVSFEESSSAAAADAAAAASSAPPDVTFR